MNKKTWYLTPKSQEETQDVPFVVGGLYKNSDNVFHILIRVVDDKYFLVNVSDGETIHSCYLSKTDMKAMLNDHYTLVAEQIEAKP